MKYQRFHEAAHALADRRGIKDTSRQGRYHNRRFKRLAEELGLHVDHDPTLGWSPISLPDTTAQQYASAIAALDPALTAHRIGEPSRPPRRAGSLACVCGCGGGFGSLRPYSPVVRSSAARAGNHSRQ